MYNNIIKKSISEVNQKFTDVVRLVDEEQVLVIDRFNVPKYVLMTVDYFDKMTLTSPTVYPQKKLHEAMAEVLLQAPNHTMNYIDIANEIWHRRLYKKRDRKKATSGQIMLRAKNYNANTNYNIKFEVIDKDIKLITFDNVEECSCD